LTSGRFTGIIDIKPPGFIAYVYCIPPFKALIAAQLPRFPPPLKTFKLRGYLVYMAYLRKMYMIVYISQYPPMAACPPSEVSQDFKSSKS